MKTGEHIIVALKAIHKMEKFLQDDKIFYPGMNESLRTEASRIMDLAIEDFITLASKELKPRLIKDVMRHGLARFDSLNLDTEDRERVCLYFQELMDIVGLESSDGLLNIWMYGFDPTRQRQT